VAALCYDDDSAADVEMNVIMTAAGRFVEIQGTAEAVAFGRDQLNTMLDLAAAACARIHATQQLAVTG
jgi:ribonuclease PH